MPSKLYQVEETAILWQDAAATYAMTLNNLAATTGMRQGAVHDFGATARAALFAWRAWFQSATAPVVGETVEVYAKTSDGTIPDNDDGTGDIAVSAADKLKNLELLGIIQVDEAATGVKFVKSGFVYLPQRYFMPIIANKTADNFVATNNLSGFQLIPVPAEAQ